MLKLLRYLDKRQRGQALLTLVFVVLQVWLDLTLPDYMATITSLAETPGSTMGQILVQGGYMMLCAAGSLVCNVICVYLASRVAAGLSRTLREKVFNQALDLSRGDVDRFGAASLVNRCTNDITQIQNLVSIGLSVIVKAPVMAIWAVVKIVGFGWEWTLATAVAALSIALMLALTVVVCIPRFQKVQGLTDVLNRLLREHLTGVRPVRAYNAEGYERERFSGANDELTDNNLIANRVMAIMNPGMTLVTSGLTLAVYWIGAVLIEAAAPGARLTLFSQMVVFSNYGMQVVLAFVLLNMIFVLLPRAQVAAERVSEVIEAEPAVTDGVGRRITRSRATTWAPRSRWPSLPTLSRAWRAALTPPSSRAGGTSLAASASAWLWAAPSPTGPRSLSSTTRSAPSTSRPTASCARPSPASAPARPSPSSPSAWARCATPTSSSCSTAAPAWASVPTTSSCAAHRLHHHDGRDQLGHGRGRHRVGTFGHGAHERHHPPLPALLRPPAGGARRCRRTGRGGHGRPRRRQGLQRRGWRARALRPQQRDARGCCVEERLPLRHDDAAHDLRR